MKRMNIVSFFLLVTYEKHIWPTKFQTIGCTEVERYAAVPSHYGQKCSQGIVGYGTKIRRVIRFRDVLIDQSLDAQQYLQAVCIDSSIQIYIYIIIIWYLLLVSKWLQWDRKGALSGCISVSGGAKS